MFQVLLEAVQARAKKTFFGAWKIDFLQSFSFLQVVRENNVPGRLSTSILRGLAAVQACAKKRFFVAWKIVFLQSPISSHTTIRGHATQKMNHKGELRTSRISSNLRIWQSYCRVPQVLKVLCVWYSWKYVARLGFELLKFLYSEFLYNTQAVYIYIHTPHLIYIYIHIYMHASMQTCIHTYTFTFTYIHIYIYIYIYIYRYI